MVRICIHVPKIELISNSRCTNSFFFKVSISILFRRAYYAGLTLWRIYGEWAYECSSP